MIIAYEVFFKDEKIGTLLTDGPGKDRFLPEKTIEKYSSYMVDTRWKEDRGFIYIPLYENMIKDTLRQNPDAKYIARFTNDFVLVKMEEHETEAFLRDKRIDI